MLDVLAAAAIQYAMKNPEAVANGAQHMMRPGVVEPSALNGNFQDFTRTVLQCYHRTARYQGMQIVGQPFNGQAQYGASHSVVVRIAFSGLSGTPYSILTAIMMRGDQPDAELRTLILSDTATVPYSRQCALENWVKVPA